MDILHRLKEIIANSGLTNNAFAKKCGINTPTLDRQLKGLRGISTETVMSVLKAFPEISSEWLLRGEGEMITGDKTDASMERVLKLVDTISTLQDAINEKSKTIATLKERIAQLENQLKTK